MQHFIVSVPRQADPIVDQAVRERVANTIEVGVHPQRFADIEEAAPPVPRLAPDPDDVAASMQRLHEKLGISDPDAEPASHAPDYGAWFQPTKDCSAPQPEESWSDALIAIFAYCYRLAKELAAAIWLAATLILGASALKASLQVWEWLT